MPQISSLLSFFLFKYCWNFKFRSFLDSFFHFRSIAAFPQTFLWKAEFLIDVKKHKQFKWIFCLNNSTKTRITLVEKNFEINRFPFLSLSISLPLDSLHANNSTTECCSGFVGCVYSTYFEGLDFPAFYYPSAT